VIDLHAHLLPGVDDGPPRMADALEMARVAVAGGVATLVCTPHLNAAHPHTLARVAEVLPLVRAELERAGIPLRLLPGAEIAFDRLTGFDDGALGAASLGGGGRWLLVELPFVGWPLGIPEALARLEMRGFGVVIAHPERSDAIQRAPDRLRDLVGRGALVQVTAGSLTGDHGPRARRAAVALLRAGFVHLLASDAHSATARPPVLADGLQMAAAELHTSAEALRWMVEEGPRLVVEGLAVRPPRLVPTRTPRGAAPRDRRAQPERRRR
jgi:protein-tyrosine phosphatase